MADMYKLQCLTVNPVENLLKTLVAANAYAVAAADAGWTITFSLSDEADQVGIHIDRDATRWPTDIDGEKAE